MDPHFGAPPNSNTIQLAVAFETPIQSLHSYPAVVRHLPLRRLMRVLGSLLVPWVRVNDGLGGVLPPDEEPRDS